jgi:hypothetical protein
LYAAKVGGQKQNIPNSVLHTYLGDGPPQIGAVFTVSPPYVCYASLFCAKLLIVPRLDFNMEEMLTLRQEGWSLLALAKKYNRCHATILYHCKRRGVSAPQLKVIHNSFVHFYTEPIPEKQSKPGDKYLDLIDEPQNNGKSYRQYYKESLAREIEHGYEKKYKKWR